MKKRTIQRKRIERLKRVCEAKGGTIIIRNRLLGKKLGDKIVVACVKGEDVVFAKIIPTKKKEKGKKKPSSALNKKKDDNITKTA